MQSWHNPKIAPLARALDETRHADPSASAAWADRMAERMRGAVSIIERLRAEGRLDPTWTPAEAAVLLRELTSFHVWDGLVNDAQIFPGRYIDIITAAAPARSAPPSATDQPQEHPGCQARLGCVKDQVSEARHHQTAAVRPSPG